MVKIVALFAALLPAAEPPPNLVWISIEDASPDFGCYGDRYADSPVIDKLAAQGIRYSRCFTHAPVCAPSRHGIITGMYPVSTGAHNMRCKAVPAPGVKCFTEALRSAGYYCTNNVKTDYQFDVPPTAWDENSAKAHWRNRRGDQPFFAVFNFTSTHESQVRNPSLATQRLAERLAPERRHDPRKAIVPPFYPDTPTVRRDLANYYDNLTAVEFQVQRLLDELDAAGVADRTIVWFFGDHGRGLPRYKRWCYDTGTRVPLIVRVPEGLKAWARPDDPSALIPGGVDDRLVAFVDFAPTVLSLAGLEIPAHLQGRAFLGPKRVATAREYVYAARDRMDERYDLIRSVRDERFRYVHNFHPWSWRAQHVSYGDLMPTLAEMRRLFAADKLAGPELHYFEPGKPPEELYDTETDPHELRNLANDPAHAETLDRLRNELIRWMRSVGDIGMIPESIFDELQRPGGETATVSAPIAATIEHAADRAKVRLRSDTPGASFAWRPGAEAPWQVAGEVVEIKKGDPFQTLACRIGFRDSPIAEIKTDEPIDLCPSAPPPAHWSDRFPRGALDLATAGWLDPLGTLGPPEAIPDATPEAAIKRYWAVLALRQARKTPAEWEQVAPRLVVAARSDPVPAVRIAAAHLLCDLGRDAAGRPTLVELLGHRQDATRLAAVLALDEIDEQARPVIEVLRGAQADTSQYVQRVAEQALRELEADDGQ